MMTKEQSLAKMREKGAEDAQALQNKAVAGEVTQTEIIDQEISVPAFNPKKDYTGWKKDSPVADEGQVWLLIQPHNAAQYDGRPSTLRALWGLAHTTNPLNAKPFVEPYGTSGLYSAGECCTDPNYADPNQVFISKVNNNAYSPSAYMDNWDVYVPVVG